VADHQHSPDKLTVARQMHVSRRDVTAHSATLPAGTRTGVPGQYHMSAPRAEARQKIFDGLTVTTRRDPLALGDSCAVKLQNVCGLNGETLVAHDW